MKNISKADLLALVDEVKKDLKDIAAKEASKLSKADAPPPVEGSASSASSMSPSPESSTSSASGSPEGSSGSPEGDMPPPGAPPAGPEASAAPPPPAGPEGSAPPPGPAGAEAGPAAGPSQEELVSLYAALAQSAPQDFEAHVAAIQQVMQQMGGGAPEGSAPPAPEGSAPPMGMGKSVHEGSSPGPHKERAEGSGSSDPDSSPVDKKEMSGSESSTSESTSSVSKSEADALRADLKKAQETIEQMGKTFEEFLTIPQRKAVTGLTIIPFREVKKSEPTKKPFGEMTEAEVKVALKDVVASPKLSKADREYINGYMLNPGQFKVEGLEPIFNKVQ